MQEELDRLLRAGKSVTNLKSKITEVCKPEYLAGSEYDRQKLEEMLLALTGWGRERPVRAENLCHLAEERRKGADHHGK